MSASSLSAASLCTRSWTKGTQWQAKSFVRNVSRTSAINRGINASQRSTTLRDGGRPSAPSSYSRGSKDTSSGRRNDRYGAAPAFSRKSDSFSDRGDDFKFASRNDGHGGRSSAKRETRRDQRRSDRRDGGNGSGPSDINDAFTKDMSDRKSSSYPSGGRDRTRAFDRNARPTQDINRNISGSFDRGSKRDDSSISARSSSRSAFSGKGGDEPSGPAYEKKSRFENEGVRAYGDNTGFFSKGSRSRRPGDRPSNDSGDRSARPRRDAADVSERDTRYARDTDRRSTGSFDRGNRSARDGDSSFDKSPRTSREGEKNFSEKSSRPSKSDRIQHDDVPVAIPYSSAASQWLYGVNTVVAALRGNRRKLYQLIVKKGERSSDADQILRLANSLGITIQTHDDTRLLDKLSEGRPHNGAVLETSALPVQPTVQLRKPDPKTNKIDLELQRQNAEEIAINGKSTSVRYNGESWRQPIVLFLDGITDPGNVGGILRTAHFYGVDAVAVATNTCCNLNSPVLAKASAGACEAIPILAVSKPADFISKSAHAGWKICAAVAPDVKSQKLRKQLTSASIAIDSPLATSPCILMMGSEGEGLRENLRSKADLEVTIAGGQTGGHVVDVGVDSMNVGVATGVLVDAFMRQPSTNVSTAATSSSDSSNRVF